LRSDIASRPVPEPTEVLVLVGAMVADVALRLFGYRPLRPEALDPEDHDRLEFEARTLGVRAAARAVAEDDPGGWADFLASFES
jgi:hypothetical protein